MNSQLPNRTSAEQEGGPANNNAASVPKIPRNKKRMIRYVKGAAGIKSPPPKPVSPENGLSIVERFFHRMPETSPQVVLVYNVRLKPPIGSKFLSVDRILDICKRTSASIYRTSSILDFETETFRPMGRTAAELMINHEFTELIDESINAFARVTEREVNRKFDVRSAAPLWNVHIIGPKGMDVGITLESLQEQDPNITTFPNFYVSFSFHHCICDGLSGLAFVRSFMSNTTIDAFQIKPLNLGDLLVSTTPPPLLDNLIDANFFELLPGIVF